MSKDTISVNMNVYDIPILVEQLEKANKEIKILKEEYVMLQNASDEVEEEKDKKIERLNNIIDELIDIIAEGLKVDVVEKAFNMSFDDFKIWLKENIKGDNNGKN